MKRKLIILTLLIAVFSIGNIFSQRWNPRPGWKDSYKVDGYCFCFTNGNGAYDHGIANKPVRINGKTYTVRAVCEELKKHPRYRSFRNGDIPYNTIQCGNPPYNDAPDEPGCPGRVDIGPRGCNQIGPKWDMAWLSTRPIFNGNGGGDGGGGNGDNGVIGTAGNGGNGPGQGPKLRVLFPTLNKRFTAPATLRVQAEATDQNGVRDVEVKIDGKLVGKKTSAPYVWNANGQENLLSNLGIKNYLIEVKATDKNGNVSIVDILIYVIQNPNGGGNNNGPNVSFSTPTNNASFTAPATFKVVVNASDNDGVGNVKLYINNSFIRQENVSPYEWNHNGQDNKLKNLSAGTYTLKAEATDKKGKKTTKTISITVGGDTGGGDGGGNNGGNGVTFKGQSINKYVSSESGSRSMRANRAEAGASERFTVESAGNGTVSLKGSNGKYVSSENGNKAMNCNRNAVGAWEKFTLESLGGDLYAIKGNNGKYVSHSNGGNNPMFCNRNAVGSWEKFIIKGLTNGRVSNSQSINQFSKQNVSVYPNPVIKSEDINVNITTFKDITSSIEVLNLNGRSIVKRNLGVLKAGTKSISINDIRRYVKTNGLYLVKVTLGKHTIVKQIMIE